MSDFLYVAYISSAAKTMEAEARSQKAEISSVGRLRIPGRCLTRL